MKRYLLPATPLAAMLLLTGCIDDNYDLSNINTTSEVKVDYPCQCQRRNPQQCHRPG